MSASTARFHLQGVNIPRVRLVILNGLPRNLVEGVQEIGRAGRDGCRAEAVILGKPDDFRSPLVSDLVKKAFSEKGCLRERLFSHFQEGCAETHRCCSFCHPPEKTFLFVQETGLNGSRKPNKDRRVIEALQTWRATKAKKARLPFAFPSTYLTEREMEALARGDPPDRVLGNRLEDQKEVLELIQEAKKAKRKDRS